MRKNPHATTNAGNQGNRALPPPPTTTHQVHNPQPPLERRLQEGPRRQSASTVRPKGQGFRPGKGGGGGGRIWKLDPPSRGRAAPERRRRRGRREIDQGFPPFQESTGPTSKPRSDKPATRSARGDHRRGKGLGGREPPTAAARPRRPHATHAAGRNGQHLRAPSTGKIDAAISTQGRRPGFQSSSRRREAADPRRHLHRKMRSSRRDPRVAARRGEGGRRGDGG
mgnify:CR=1 FL=1